MQAPHCANSNKFVMMVRSWLFAALCNISAGCVPFEHVTCVQVIHTAGWPYMTELKM